MMKLKFSSFVLIVMTILIYLPQPADVHAQEAPFLYGVYPQVARPGETIKILLSGDGLDRLDQLGFVILNDQQIAFQNVVKVSNQVVMMQLELPETLAVGATEISFIFGNFGMDAYFNIVSRENQEIAPSITFIEPREGVQDSEFTLHLQGSRLFELGELGGIVIGESEIPILAEDRESDRSALISFFLPPEIPSGEAEISLFFENLSYQDRFQVWQPETSQTDQPIIYGISPQEAFTDSEIELYLEGENLSWLGNLNRLFIANMEIPIQNYFVESDRSAVLVIYLPPDLQPGETLITFLFDNFKYDGSFLVQPRETTTEPQRNIPHIWDFSPRDGDPDSGIELYIEGENLSEIGTLLGLSIDGVEIPVENYELVSNDSMLLNIYLPENTPLGEQVLALRFANTGFEDFFYVNEPSSSEIPPAIILGAGVTAAIGGWALARTIRNRKPDKKRTSKKEDLDINFKVSIDYGIQSIEPSRPALDHELNIKFIVKTDPGEQTIETD
jgi:hypothetical protein